MHPPKSVRHGCLRQHSVNWSRDSATETTRRTTRSSFGKLTPLSGDARAGAGWFAPGRTDLAINAAGGNRCGHRRSTLSMQVSVGHADLVMKRTSPFLGSQIPGSYPLHLDLPPVDAAGG
jgi:hypothetical protein